MSDRSVTPHPGLPSGWFPAQLWPIGSDSAVRPLIADDLEHLRTWRNEQQDVLRQQAPIDIEHQQRWFRDVVVPSQQHATPSSVLVTTSRSGVPTSYGGLTNIDWVSRRAEVSFLAATDIASSSERYEAEFGGFLSWLTDFSFGELDLCRLFTETWAFRDHHLEILERAGFQLEGRLRHHVVKDCLAHDALMHGLLRSDIEKEI